MYKFEKQNYGMQLSTSGDFDEKEICQLAEEITSMASSIEKPFSIFVDTREMWSLGQSTLSTLIECQQAASRAGLERSVVVLISPVIRNQLRRVAADSGISDGERYINAAKNEDWEKVAMDWILRGIEPASEVALSK